MAEPKTKPNSTSALDFINNILDKGKREDSLALLDLFENATGQKPRMWGTSIIGFGQYHYKSEKSSQEGDWPLIAFSPRKQKLTLYISDAVPGFAEYPELLNKLGKYKTSKVCLYINKLSDVDMAVLKQLVKKAYVAMKKKHKA